MRLVLKQLHLYFPFVFPLYIDDGIGGASYVEAAEKEKERQEFLVLKKQVEELEARSKPSFVDIIVEQRKEDAFSELQKQVKDLTARVKELEEKLEEKDDEDEFWRPW